MQLDTLLCPVSLSISSRCVLRSAGYMAHRYGARLRILHVIDRKRQSALDPVPETDRVAAAVKAAETRFVEAVPIELRAGVRWEVVIVEGDIGTEVTKAAEDPSVDLVFMGFKSAPAVWAGHWLDRVLKQVKKPVLALPATAPPANAALWRHILLATDLAPESEPTHNTAIELARMSGAELTVVHVVEDIPPAVMAPEVLPVPEYRAFALQEASRQLDNAFGPLWPQAAKMVLPGGVPGREIARLAHAEVADLIVIGYRKGYHFFGTLADRLLNASDCAVMVVPHTTTGRLAHIAAA
jgi:universal stress protein A